MNQELEKYVDLIMSMSVDFKMGQISEEHYLNMLKLMIESISERKILQ